MYRLIKFMTSVH